MKKTAIGFPHTFDGGIVSVRASKKLGSHLPDSSGAVQMVQRLIQKQSEAGEKASSCLFEASRRFAKAGFVLFDWSRPFSKLPTHLFERPTRFLKLYRRKEKIRGFGNGYAFDHLTPAANYAAGRKESKIMARQKRKSAAVEFAEKRANSLASVDAALDLGNGLTLADYKTRTAALKAKNDKYNTDLSNLDGDLNSILSDERSLDDRSGRMLAGVGSKYGKDSAEYEKAGGTRTSERKPPVRKNKKATP